MANRIQLRRGTAAEWLAANPVLAQGEPGIEKDTGKAKYGDGVTAWSGLSYATKGDPGVPGADGADGTVDDASVAGAIGQPLTSAALSAAYARKGDVPTGAVTSTQVFRIVAVLDGDPVPVLQDGDLVVRYTIPGSLYSLNFDSEVLGGPVTKLTKVSGVNWITSPQADAAGAVNTQVLRIAGAGSFYTIPELASDPYRDESEILVRYKHGALAKHGPQFYFFGDETFANGVQVSYAYKSSINGSLVVRSKVGTGMTDIAVVNFPHITNGQWVMMRARRVGKTLSFKVWADGTMEPEAWGVSALITTELATRNAIGRTSDQGTQFIDWVSVATGGRTAVAQ